MARACVELLGDPARCEALGVAAREVRLREHSSVPAHIGPKVEDVVAFLDEGDHDVCLRRPK